MRRRLNDKLLFWTLAGCAVLATAVHLLHGHQLQRNAGTMARQALRALDGKEYGKAAELFGQYLGYEPNDTDAMAYYAIALPKSSSSAQTKFKTHLLLEQVLRRQPNRLDTRQQAVQAAIDVGRMPDAIHHLEYLLTVVPRKEELEHRLGWCQEAVGQYDASADSFKRAITLAPQQIESYILLAELLAQRFGQADQALKVMNDMVAVNPASWQAALARGRFHYGRGSLNSAAADIYRASELAPNEDEALLAAAEIAFLEGDLAKTRQFLSHGLEHFPKNQFRPLLLQKLSKALLVKGDKQEAQVVLRQVAELLPKDLESRISLFDLALGDQRYTEADALIVELRRIEGEDGLLWRAGQAAQGIAKARAGEKSQLALTRQQLAEVRERGGAWARAALLQGYLEELDGRAQQAIASYREAIRLGERPPAVVLHVARWLSDEQHFAEAGQVLKLLEEQRPLPRDHARLAAEVALQCEEPQRAAALARTAVPPGSRDFRDHIWLAQMLWLAGRAIEAEDTLLAAVQISPRIPDVWVALVRHLARTKQSQVFDEVLKEMEEKVPPERVTLTLARCLAAAGRVEEAESAFGQLVIETPGDFISVRHFAEFYLHADQPAKAEPLLGQLISPSASIPADLAVWARRQMAIALMLRGKATDLEQALALLGQNLGPNGPFPEDERVRAYVLSKNPALLPHAVDLFEKSLTKKSLTPQERFLLVQILDANHDTARAERQLEILLAMDRDKPQYLVYSIRKLLEKGAVDAARACLGFLEHLEPDSPRTQQLSAAVHK